MEHARISLSERYSLDGYTLTDIVHNLLEDYIEERETQWFEAMSAKKLSKIHEAKANGTPIDKTELTAQRGSIPEGREKYQKRLRPWR